MIGTDIPQGLDAESIWSVMAGEKSQIRETLFTAYKDVQRSVRDDRWKLITYPQISKSQLFDLQNDPQETRDLSGQPACQSHTDRLWAAMQGWQKKTGDTSPLVSKTPQDATFKAPTPAELEILKKSGQSKKKKTKQQSSQKKKQ